MLVPKYELLQKATQELDLIIFTRLRFSAQVGFVISFLEDCFGRKFRFLEFYPTIVICHRSLKGI